MAFFGENSCKVWVKCDTSVSASIDDSFNVSSVADRGTGRYTVNFTNAMSNTNYAAVFGCNGNTTAYSGPETQNTGSIDTFGSFAGSFNDLQFFNMAIFGDQ
tara:strand:- start:253 stop:558 length:306 start_codon:yes stop_codon:yes gene_type:complete